MQITFTNGTPEQHQVVREALGDLLHLDTDAAFPFAWEISFIPNPVADEHVHHPFAVTVLNGSVPTTKFRDDFPRFEPTNTWGSPGFARETVIHELGHAAEVNLATDVQEKVAQLFGVAQADLYPTEKAWQDRPGEGMAETFKDAFLPQHLREFANRTNVKLPIPKYPEFRHLFRSGSGGGGGDDVFLRNTPNSDFSLGPPSSYDGVEGLASPLIAFYPNAWLAGSDAVLTDDAALASSLGLTVDGPLLTSDLVFDLTLPESSPLYRVWDGGAFQDWSGFVGRHVPSSVVPFPAPGAFAEDMAQVLAFIWWVQTYDGTNGWRTHENWSIGWAVSPGSPEPEVGGLYQSDVTYFLDFVAGSTVNSFPLIGPGESFTHTYEPPGGVDLVRVSSVWFLTSATYWQDVILGGGLPSHVNVDDVLTDPEVLALQPRAAGGIQGTPQEVPRGETVPGDDRAGRRRTHRRRIATRV